MLPQVIPCKMLPFLIIILLTLAQNGLMVSKQQSLSRYNPNLISFPKLSPFEMDVPEELEALGSKLTVRIRLSLAPFLNESEYIQRGINTGEGIHLQLGIYEGNGDLFALTQQKIPTISTNWQEVDFDCGWIVKGGKYAVRLIQTEKDIKFDFSSSTHAELNIKEPALSSHGSVFPSSNGTDLRRMASTSTTTTSTTPSPLPNQYRIGSNETFNIYIKAGDELNPPSSLSHYQQASGGGERVLAIKTINVKYPTISFEVPTRLETYTTAAPVTFGLTRTICKPKLKLPSTVLTLTMCSLAASENSGPSANHFSFNPGDSSTRHMSPSNKPITPHSQSGSSGSSGSSTAPHFTRLNDVSHNRDRHHRRYNPEHHSSPSWSNKSGKRYNSSDDIYSNPVDEGESRLECHRDVTVIYQDPLEALQTEGRVTINVECQLWGRNATYVIKLREADSSNVIAQSPLIKVEWSSQFSLKLSRSSVLRCQGSIRVLVSHPQCVLPGRDKIRVYGYETLPVPSLLAPRRVSYIGEQQIRKNNRILSFRCEMFPARFLRFCFHYVNTAVDESVAVVVEKCIPTGPASKIADGGWSTWSKWSSCSVTCGAGGKRFRYRFCDSPPPTTGANFCQGKAIQEEPCDSGMPCPQTHGRRQLSSTSPQIGSSRRGNEISPTYPGEGERVGRTEGSRRLAAGSGRPTFMDFSVLNVSTTPGCECGCILYDLIPTKNYSLVILISANQSSCADEDEEDHHNFRWILHARDDKDRIRLDIVGMDVQCVTMTFRDGNTTDSNLLEVITASQPSDPIQFEGLYERELGQKSGGSPPMYSHYQYPDDEIEDESGEEDSEEDEEEEEEYAANRENRNLYERNEIEEESTTGAEAETDTKGSISILRIESTGSSLSIGTTTDSSKNCSGQFIYFVAYYSTIPLLVPGVAERKEEKIGYDFWSFLIVKVLVLFFIGIVACSMFAGCFTKMYAKYKYKELKCFENDEEEGSLNEEENGEVRKSGRDTLDDASRCTSITLMSFDYGYWRRLRILRLKYFLLRPRPLDPVTTKTKSFPNTPTPSTKMKEVASTSGGRNNTSTNGKTLASRARGNERISKIQTTDDHPNALLLNKPISFSESNLRDKVAVLAVTNNGYELRRAVNKKPRSGGAHPGGKDDDSCEDTALSTSPKRGTNSDEHGSAGDVYGNASLASTSVSISISQSLNGSETASSNNSFSTPTPTPTPAPEKSKKKNNGRFVKGDLCSSGIKLLKEQENLKRKAGERAEKGGGTPDSHSKGSSVTPNSLSGSERSHRGILKKIPARVTDDMKGKRRQKLILRHGDSTASVSTVQSAGLSTTGDEDSSRVASRADLEDTDQDFEMDYYDYDMVNAGNIPGSYLGLEPALVVWNSELYPHSDDEHEHNSDDDQGSSRLGAGSHLGGDTKGCMEDSAYGIEMTPSSSSIGMFSQDTMSSGKDCGMKETSLDTLKFADEDDEEEDDDEIELYTECTETIPLRHHPGELSSQLKYKDSNVGGDIVKL